MYKVIGADQKQYGPANADHIRQWITEGRVNAQTQAQAEGGSGWKPLGSFPEFAGAFPPPPASPPPPFPRHPAGSPPAADNGMAVTGFVLSLIGVFCCAGVFSTLGLVFSCVALSEMRDDPNHRSRGLAIAGIVLALFKFLVLIGLLPFFLFGRGFRRLYF
jgi:hypothetical protein